MVLGGAGQPGAVAGLLGVRAGPQAEADGLAGVQADAGEAGGGGLADVVEVGGAAAHDDAELERIARAAVEHLDTAETVFLDEGFHPLLVGRALPTDRDLTIVTACLPTAIELAERPRTQVVVIGGRVRPITLASVERWATRMLREMEPDLAVVGANGVSEEGWLTTPHASVAEVKETVLGTAGRAIFVGSHTKFGHSTFARFGHVRQLERVITGRELRSSTARRLTGLGAVIERV